MRRDQVQSGDVVYSCNCGFIDKGHANPTGARNLWRKVHSEVHETDWLFHNDHTLEDRPAFVISYYQSMAKFGMRASAGGEFLIRKGLSLLKKKSVALAIFMTVSIEFESMQEGVPFGWVTNSGFSPEDLMSNLIGFHRAIDGYSMEDMEQACGALDTAKSLKVYDANAAELETMKVERFLEPRYFACDDCSRNHPLPEVLSSLRPAPNDGSWIELPSTFADQWRDGRVLNFDRRGRVTGHRLVNPNRRPAGPQNRTLTR